MTPIEEIRECDRCVVKSGAPDLCPACRHNRALVGRLKAERDHAVSARDQFAAELERQGFRRCDVAACNCGWWHKVSDSLIERSLRLQLENVGKERNHWRDEHEKRRGECLAAQMVEKAAQDRAERAQELQRGAEAQHCAALARVVELEAAQMVEKAAQDRAERARELQRIAEAKLAKAREALQLEERMSLGFDSEDDLRSARLVADRARRAVLSDEEPKP